MDNFDDYRFENLSPEELENLRGMVEAIIKGETPDEIEDEITTNALWFHESGVTNVIVMDWDEEYGTADVWAVPFQSEVFGVPTRDLVMA